MMKHSLAALVLSLSLTPAFAAKPCKVYGISDSPQRLHCKFPGHHVILSCSEGRYYLNQSPVGLAFHLEVESGTVPLVFKSPGMTLTALIDGSPQSSLEVKKAELLGSCRPVP